MTNHTKTATTCDRETIARDHYEASRRRVRGRPSWGNLDPKCSYDMGMKSYAYECADKILAEKGAS